jgi:hypothetical protein
MSPHLSGLQVTKHVLISFSESEKSFRILEVVMSLRLCCIICRLRLCLATCGSSDKELAAELEQLQLLVWLGKARIKWSKSAPFSVGVLRGDQLRQGGATFRSSVNNSWFWLVWLCEYTCGLQVRMLGWLLT